jgi:hypothetical protein
MMTLTRFRRFVPWIACGIFAAMPVSAVQSITVDPSTHYLIYNGQPLPLLGVSSEYLPHISRPSRASKYCTYEYALFDMGCLAVQPGYGINTFRLWVSLNSSIGVEDQGTPYPNEQPFVYSGGKWNLDSYDDAGFFTHLQNVIDYADQLGMIVEVTLIDQAGDSRHSGP